MLIVLCFMVVTMGHAYVYSDYDIDGVEDSKDDCPNTPFDLTVDEHGCAEGSKAKGTWTLLTGTITGIDKDADTLTNFLLYVNYRYKSWDFSASTFNDIQNTTTELPNTLYLTTGYRFKPVENIQMKVSVGTKQSDVQDDYYLSTNVDYVLDENKNLFLYYGYTVAQDSSTQKYDNFHTLSFGVGSALTDYWYSALSYDYSGATLRNTDDYKVLSWVNTFALTPKYYFVTNYSYGLNTATTDHTISVQFGVKFD